MMSISMSAQIRQQLGYPVIDTDIHTGEFLPIFLEYLEKIGGITIVDKFMNNLKSSFRFRWYSQSGEERHSHRTLRPPWWVRVADANATATLTIPKLLYQHLEETGIDYAILYPNLTILAPPIGDEELRRSVCRAANIYHADMYQNYADRMTPVAAIPMHTPEEAIAELEYVVNVLKFKAIQITGYVRRPIKAIVSKYPDLAHEATWVDTFGLDSEHNYDPFWEKCVELQVALATHSGGMGWTDRRSISNFVYNHIGHFSSACQALCKSLFLGGVTRRYPTLKFAFLEAGAGWSVSLYADLIWHWEKRNIKAIHQYNPINIDQKLLQELFLLHGKDFLIGNKFNSIDADSGIAAITDRHMLEPIDEFAAIGIETIEQIRDYFVPNFYFGCAADDFTIGSAFNAKVNPLGVRLNAFLASDSGHWDVPDISAVISSAYELVEKGIVSETDLKNFLFSNPVDFYGETNPKFFQGTILEKEAKAHLLKTSKSPKH